MSTQFFFLLSRDDKRILLSVAVYVYIWTALQFSGSGGVGSRQAVALRECCEMRLGEYRPGVRAVQGGAVEPRRYGRRRDSEMASSADATTSANSAGGVSLVAVMSLVLPRQLGRFIRVVVLLSRRCTFDDLT